ncbi:MAG: bifunctional 5,10-methylenetetrahydrofolate dehydrogenase/5,10-methenyltetrahydrofolate cyclohydrolase [Chloroflexota bacterium]
MPARLLDGRKIAQSILDDGRHRAQKLPGLPPRLAVVLIGDSPPAQVYATQLAKLGGRSGVEVSRLQLGGNMSIDELQAQVAALNADRAVDGILIQMPLPEHLVSVSLDGMVDGRKDVDGITVQNAGRLYLGLPGQRPSTAVAIMDILQRSGVVLEGAHAVVVGRSPVVGHPVAEMLLATHASVTILHRRSPDLQAFTVLADVLVVAAGAPGLISPGMVKPGAVVVDAGITSTDEGFVGDVQSAVAEVASALTPVPGGVGPVTTAVLLRAVIDSAEQRGT